MNDNNFFIAIRAANERTEQECITIVKEQAGKAEVTIIRETPFKKALEESFREGIASKKKWLITIDADMLLLPGAISLLIKEADKMPENYLQLQGRIQDKITGSQRKAGPRIYRVSMLNDLLSLSESMEDHIRPESRLITNFGKMGWPSRYIHVVLCYHDYEQFYKDLYRKAYVHAVKHPKLLPEIIKRSVNKKDNDNDYNVILQAIWDSLTQNMEVAIDTRLFENKAKSSLNSLGLKEKQPFTRDLIYQTYNENMQYAPDNLLKKSFIPYNDQPPVRKPSLQKVLEGGFRGVVHKFGSVLIKTGKKLQVN